ncbi:hypothetical protein Salmuc_00100 [Salipiger mucosus DSM 16094]|uniref:Uncharacterized protein n=1 Tax=Salipiger mucosus DSM 16094 TaxID=1123237 RepID=S9Q2D4_9RHOB|nr:hypothetical protein Salmuc_00100 [Salipiger mucosus DSM 16094]
MRTGAGPAALRALFPGPGKPPGTARPAPFTWRAPSRNIHGIAIA